jgi:hypothetical protein
MRFAAGGKYAGIILRLIGANGIWAKTEDCKILQAKNTQMLLNITVAGLKDFFISCYFLY